MYVSESELISWAEDCDQALGLLHKSELESSTIDRLDNIIGVMESVLIRRDFEVSSEITDWLEVVTEVIGAIESFDGNSNCSKAHSILNGVKSDIESVTED